MGEYFFSELAEKFIWPCVQSVMYARAGGLGV